MSTYTHRDVRRALALELAISEVLGDMSGDAQARQAGEIAHAASQARIAALQTLLKRTPDDEVFDAEFY